MAMKGSNQTVHHDLNRHSVIPCLSGRRDIVDFFRAVKDQATEARECVGDELFFHV